MGKLSPTVYFEPLNDKIIDQILNASLKISEVHESSILIEILTPCIKDSYKLYFVIHHNVKNIIKQSLKPPLKFQGHKTVVLNENSLD